MQSSLATRERRETFLPQEFEIFELLAAPSETTNLYAQSPNLV